MKLFLSLNKRESMKVGEYAYEKVNKFNHLGSTIIND